MFSRGNAPAKPWCSMPGTAFLGDRFKVEQVRQGRGKKFDRRTFDVPKLREFHTWWKDHGFDKPDSILIRREGTPTAVPSLLNDQPVTLATLQELGAFLVDVHGQNEHSQVLKSSVQLALLDRFADSRKNATRSPRSITPGKIKRTKQRRNPLRRRAAAAYRCLPLSTSRD